MQRSARLIPRPRAWSCGWGTIPIETELFDKSVGLEDLNVLRNLSEPEATRTLAETLKEGINALTVQDRGTTEIRDSIKLSRTRPYASVFKQDGRRQQLRVGIRELPRWLRWHCLVREKQSTVFRIEYRNADGSIANYIPDYIVNRSEAEIWIIETKGREDLDDRAKWERLQQWCSDATAHNGKRSFHPLRPAGRVGGAPAGQFWTA
jgi:type III restriction enzyme